MSLIWLENGLAQKDCAFLWGQAMPIPGSAYQDVRTVPARPVRTKRRYSDGPDLVFFTGSNRVGREG